MPWYRCGGGGSATLATKSITSNGTYNASSDNADGYSSVTVSVPATEYLVNTSAFTTPGYISKTDGSLVTDSGASGWSASEFIAVNAGEVLKVASPINWDVYNAWYDSSKNFVSNFKPASVTGYTTLTVPSGASYMRISAATSNMQRTMIWRDPS